MSSRLDSLRVVDPILTNLALGYSPDYLIGNKLFPTVKVSSQKGRIPKFGKDSFVLRNSNRAIRSNSNRIPSMEFETVEFSLQERDLEVAMDYLEESETYNLLQYEEKMMQDLMNILSLEKEKTIADFVQNPSNFASDMKLAMADGDNFASLSQSPLTAIHNGIEQVRSKISRKPNIMIIGASAYKSIVSHTDFTYSLNNVGKAWADLAYLKELFNIDNIVIGNSVSSNDGTTFEDIWQDNVLIAYVDKSDKKSQYNPSYGYILQREGMPEIDTYFENGGKVKIIRATDNWAMKVVAPEAAYLIHNTN
jgi:hypothetical protein